MSDPIQLEHGEQLEALLATVVLGPYLAELTPEDRNPFVARWRSVCLTHASTTSAFRWKQCVAASPSWRWPMGKREVAAPDQQAQHFLYSFEYADLELRSAHRSAHRDYIRSLTQARGDGRAGGYWSRWTGDL